MAHDPLIRDWVAGWAASHGAARPVTTSWGYTVHVGLRDQVARHVIAARNADVSEAVVRAVAASTSATVFHLKVFADPARVVPWLGAGWVPYGAGDCLMTRALTSGGRSRVPRGFEVRMWTRGQVTRVLVTDRDGSFAARGQCAVRGTNAVADQIETHEAFRRRGLGTAVMSVLQAEARRRGAERAVLSATGVGRHLYEALGWEVVAPLTNARFDTVPRPGNPVQAGK